MGSHLGEFHLWCSQDFFIPLRNELWRGYSIVNVQVCVCVCVPLSLSLWGRFKLCLAVLLYNMYLFTLLQIYWVFRSITLCCLSCVQTSHLNRSRKLQSRLNTNLPVISLKKRFCFMIFGQCSFFCKFIIFDSYWFLQ